MSTRNTGRSVTIAPDNPPSTAVELRAMKPLAPVVALGQPGAFF